MNPSTVINPTHHMSGHVSHGNHDVLFAYMPYHKLTHPALGASILKSCLVQAGISTLIKYYGLDFAEIIGANKYNSLLNSSTVLLKGEWTFAEAAFGEGFLKQQEAFVGRPYPWVDDTAIKVAKHAKDWIQHVVEQIAESRPKIVICSSMFQQNLASLAVLRGVKALSPDIYTIMGGPNTESILGIGLLRRAKWLDYVCTGEGEESLPLLCNSLLQGNANGLKTVGVIAQEDISKYDGALDVNLERSTLKDMDKSPVPCFDDYFNAINNSSISVEPGLLLESSRGCWWGQRSHCTFCGLNGKGMNYRAKTPIEMVKTVNKITHKYKIRKIEFVDNIIAKNYFDQFLTLLDCEQLTLFYETKADISEKQVKQFRSSGVRYIQPGIESLSDPVLKLMRKGTSASLNLQCLRLCREYGIRPSWSILSGFPGEEDNWYNETLELLPKLFHLRPPNGFIPIRLDRFSPYHNSPSQWNLELEPFEAYLHIYPDYQGYHDDIAYFFKRLGRDELKDDGLGAWSKTHRACRKIAIKWRDYWAERLKAGLYQPSLLLVQEKGEKPLILDERNPGGVINRYSISQSMVDLLLYCRKYRSRAVLTTLISNSSIQDQCHLDQLLIEAIEQGLIVVLNNQIITLVQLYNDVELSISHWPGGRILNQTTK